MRLEAITFWLSAFIASSSTAPAIAQNEAGGFLAHPTVRLWYEETGRLSDNIIGADEFYLWNTIIGEGSAEEQANDALFTIDLRSDGQQNIAQPLTLIATDQDGKVLARRSFTNLLTSDAGNVTVALWVPDVGCAGTVTFRATFGQSSRTSSLDFNCGE